MTKGDHDRAEKPVRDPAEPPSVNTILSRRSASCRPARGEHPMKAGEVEPGPSTSAARRAMKSGGSRTT